MSITPKEAVGLIDFASLAGFDLTDAIARNPKGAGVVYAAALNEWGLTVPEAQAAILAIVREPWTSEYRRKVPTPGEIVARTPVGRRALELGTDEDCDRAWMVCLRVLKERHAAPTAWQHLSEQETTGRAFLAGLAAMGGWNAWRMSNPSDPWPIKAWKEGYRAERRRQASEPREVRAMLTAAQAPRMLEGK